MKKIKSDPHYFFQNEKFLSERVRQTVWPNKFRFFKAFFKDLFDYMLLNTIHLKSLNSEGFAHTDFCKEFHGAPPTRIYRIIKKMESRGWIEHEEVESGGRPKHLYKETTLGVEHLQKLQKQIGYFFDHLKDQFPDWVDVGSDSRIFLQNLTLLSFVDPIEHIQRKDISDTEKITILEGIKKDMEKKHEKVNQAIIELKTQGQSKKQGEN